MRQYNNNWLALCLIGICLLLLLHSCNKEDDPASPSGIQVPEEEPFEKLSEYGLYKGPMKELNPEDALMPYTLNSTLFSDYALKKRFIYIPDDKKAQYQEDKPLIFPNNSMIIKNFYYLENMQDPSSAKNIIETRILRKYEGKWSAHTYVWNDDQTEAKRLITGDIREISWTDEQGETKTAQYMIPNENECKGCHALNNEMRPIGPRARHMNRNNDFEEGQHNQLVKMKNEGNLEGMPSMSDVPKIPKWDDPSTGSIEDRARAYLDINCGFCHSPEGDADNSALHLEFDVDNKGDYGICKRPIAAGGGAGGRTYDIVPGKPDSSILVYRMEADDANIRMPEIGRSVVHEEAVALIRDWISEMEGDCD